MLRLTWPNTSLRSAAESISIRLSSAEDGVLSFSAFLNSSMNELRLNWYMWLSARRSRMRKYSLDPWAAMGRYALRCSSRDSCSVVDSSRDSFTVVPFAFVSSSDVMSCSFSRILPVEVASVSSNVFSSPAS